MIIKAEEYNEEIELASFLIVDDEEIIHNGLKSVLKRNFRGKTYLDFYSPVEIKEYLAEVAELNRIDEIELIFLDNYFLNDGIRGIEILDKIRKYAPNVPIIFLTAEDKMSEVEKIMKYKAVRYQHKPIDETQICMTIKSIISDTNEMVTYEEILKEISDDLNSLRKVEDDTDDEKVEKIYKIITSRQERIIEEQKNNYDDYYKEFKKSFPRFDDKTIKFLSTGEFLYHNIDNDSMDFSPLAIDYSKTIEYVMNIVLKKNNVISMKEKIMLGNACIIVDKQRNIWKEWFPNKLHKIRDLRNKSAHPEGVSKKQVDSIREILLDSRFVPNGTGMLKYLHAILCK